MVGKNYCRSFSFPIPSSKPTPAVPGINGKGSTSLPCRFHPFISQLHDEIRSLERWRDSPSRSPSWICEGLAQLDRLHSTLLDDLLRHPHAQEAIVRQSSWANSFLDESLCLADAYCSFQSAVLSLKQELAATHAAVRRNDASRIATCLRSQRKAEKELTKITTTMKCKNRKWGPFTDTAEAELVGIVREVLILTMTISAVLFGATVGLSSSATTSSSSSDSFSPLRAVRPMVRRLSSFKKGTRETEEVDEHNWRRNCLQKLDALQECLAEVEALTGKVLRSMINTRVFLLNVLTPSL